MNKYSETRAIYLREWRCWYEMNKRCDNNVRYWKDINVCDEWKGPDGFIQFIDDMGPRPSVKHCVFRKDKNGDFTPQNTRWATREEDIPARDLTNIIKRAKTLYKYRKGNVYYDG